MKDKKLREFLGVSESSYDTLQVPNEEEARVFRDNREMSGHKKLGIELFKKQRILIKTIEKQNQLIKELEWRIRALEMIINEEKAWR